MSRQNIAAMTLISVMLFVLSLNAVAAAPPSSPPAPSDPLPVPQSNAYIAVPSIVNVSFEVNVSHDYEAALECALSLDGVERDPE